MVMQINRTARAIIAALRGGAVTVQDLSDHDATMLDFARVQTIASPVTLTAAIQYVYSRAGSSRPFYFCGGFFSQDSGAWATGEQVDINVQVSTDGTNWVNCWNAVQLAAAAAPLDFAVPHEAMGTLLGGIPRGFWVGPNNGVRVGIVQGVEGAAFGVWSHNFVDGVPST